MKKFHYHFLLTFIAFSSSIHANSVPNFDRQTQAVLENHFHQFKDKEYFSGIALSVSIPNEKIKNYYVGNVSHDTNSEKISENTLFEIGSITKSYTAAVVLQLESEAKLSINDTLGHWLPQYSKWSTISIKQMLNMTSGLPNYSDVSLMNAAAFHDLAHVWKADDLINFAYPGSTFSPPLKTNFYYTNTGYILIDKIVEHITKNTFQDELTKRTIQRADLQNTYYMPAHMVDSVYKRLARGYAYNQYDLPALVGHDVTDNNLSWAGAAGGVISNSEDIIHWVNALFLGNNILDPSQKKKLEQLISIETGKSVSMLSAKDPKGFALGVSQGFDKDLGIYWYYEGSTLGYRAIYMYTVCNKIIISAIFNSATNSENDHVGLLMKKMNSLILKQHPELVCVKK